ncbi:NAD-dependent protein deacetylase [Lentisalinibacter sediminis]|uniref:NAD-dependent protein deacetylase n=1 Tax=Lentisalinibacter sediminis TaxID=2992237 RepID=UPI0038630197
MSRFRQEIPETESPEGAGTEALARFLGRHPRLFVLTGAGCSTASGIPDYRDPAGEWKHARPVQYADFMARHSVRQRYWARSMVGWPRMAAARPNAAHHALNGLQERGRLERLVTQNVDGLHQKAGTADVIDLHGRIDTVVCMQCRTELSRADWQAEVAALNPAWERYVGAASDRPDGDVDLADADYTGFVVPPCPRCGGVVKPHVVFFGEAVPPGRVADARAALGRADALLVVGSSLMVFSGFRFARYAAEAGKAVAIVNRGRTRADELAVLKVDGDCGEVLGAVLEGDRA